MSEETKEIKDTIYIHKDEIHIKLEGKGDKRAELKHHESKLLLRECSIINTYDDTYVQNFSLSFLGQKNSEFTLDWGKNSGIKPRTFVVKYKFLWFWPTLVEKTN